MRLLVLLAAITCSLCEKIDNEAVKRELRQFNQEYLFMSWVSQSLDWKYTTNLTRDNSESLGDFHAFYNRWMLKWKNWARALEKAKVTVDDERRRVVSLMTNGVVCDDSNDSRLLSILKSKLSKIYGAASVFIGESGLTLRGEEEVNRFMASHSDNPHLLQRVWRTWQEAVGRRVRGPFTEMVRLLNKCARDNGYGDYGMAWRSELEMNDVAEKALQLWSSVRPFYQLLLAHVRRRLRLNSSGSIPVHLLGSLWGYNWEHLEPLLRPYPELTHEDDVQLKPNETLSLAQDIYLSLGMPRLPNSFWRQSVFTKPTDQRTVHECQGAAYDFSVQDDVRMRACLNGSSADLGLVLHEMGHVMYFMAYRSQPMIFRNSPNSAFHEALGDAVSDGVRAPWCSKTSSRQRLPDKKEVINYLMKEALSKVAILPWALAVDLWRYKVFSGEIPEERYNAEWWEMRERLQGVCAPESNHGDFDPGTKYHVVKGLPYMRYFLASFLQYQFLEAMCGSGKINKDKPLFECCLFGSKEAGGRIWDMMSKGASLNWQEVLKSFTGRDSINAQPLLAYYQPLVDWLRQHEEHN